MDSLTLVHSELKGTKDAKTGATTSARKYYDFYINDQSLSELFKTNNIGAFWLDKHNEENVHASVAKCFLLIEKSEIVSGKVPIFICAECGDIECGAVTVRITEETDKFVWSDFVYEVNDPEVIKEYKNVGPFTFDKDEYKKLFSQFLK